MNKQTIKIIYLVLFMLLEIAYSSKIHAEMIAEPIGMIYQTNTKQNISSKTLIEELSHADIVLVGEQHNMKSHHQAEQWLLQNAMPYLQTGSILLEMLDSSQEKSIIDVQIWLKNGGNTTIKRLSQKIDWNDAWDWHSYSNIVNYILRSSAKVLPASPTHKRVMEASIFTPSGPNSSQQIVRDSLAKIISNLHKSDTHSMVSMQQFKDYVMAQNLLTASKPAWLIAGGIHTSKQLGIPLFLRDAHFQGNVKTILLTERNSDISHEHADYIWYLEPNNQ